MTDGEIVGFPIAVLGRSLVVPLPCGKLRALSCVQKGSVHDQLGSALLEAGELKMKMVEGRSPSTAFMPLVRF
jgi:hypothetical protein